MAQVHRAAAPLTDQVAAATAVRAAATRTANYFSNEARIRFGQIKRRRSEMAPPFFNCEISFRSFQSADGLPAGWPIRERVAVRTTRTFAALFSFRLSS